jgi:hypothetical protein
MEKTIAGNYPDSARDSQGFVGQNKSHLIILGYLLRSGNYTRVVWNSQSGEIYFLNHKKETIGFEYTQGKAIKYAQTYARNHNRFFTRY